jgi:hypothetical protein
MTGLRVAWLAGDIVERHDTRIVSHDVYDGFNR